MILQKIFNPSLYAFSNYALLQMLVSVVILITVATVFYRRRRLIGFSYFLWGVSGVLWMAGQGLCYWTSDYELAWFFYRTIAFFGVSFIAVLGYGFSISWEKVFYLRHRRVLFAGLLFFAFIYIANLFTPFVCPGMHQYYYGYYPSYGKMSALFLIPWFLYYLMTCHNFYALGKKTPVPRQKTQYFSILSTAIIIYIGAVDFLPTFGVEIYAFGYIAIMFVLILMSYNVLHYRPLDLKTVLIKSASVLLVTLPVYFLVVAALILGKSWLARLTFLGVTFTFLIYFYFFMGVWNRAYVGLLNKLTARYFPEYDRIDTLSHEISTYLVLEELLRVVTERFIDIFKVSKAAYIIEQAVDGSYRCTVSHGYKDAQAKQMFLRKDDFLINWLDKKKEVLDKNQISVDPDYKELVYNNVLAWMTEFEIEVLVPLVVEGKIIGILGLGEKAKRKFFNREELRLLREFGHQFGVAIHNAENHESILAEKKMERELELGREIQMNLVPRQHIQIEGLKVVGSMEPAREIGGDYFDFIPKDQGNKLGVVIGDVSGKGVAAGLLMVMAKMSLLSIASVSDRADEILGLTNEVLYQNITGEKFMTMLYFEWDKTNKSLRYSSAGHEHIMWYRKKTGQVELIKSGGFMLGMLQDIRPMLEEHFLPVENGDKIILYTDGITEAECGEGERYGLDKLTALVERNKGLEIEELLHTIKEELKGFMGSHPQYDDMTLVGMQIQ